LSPAEYSDFMHDADLVIRGVLEKELGATFDPIFLRR
jgi:hypothetical protein